MDRIVTTIVAPVDFSEPSKRSARYAAALVRRLGESAGTLVSMLESAGAAPKMSQVVDHSGTRALDERLYNDARAQLTSLGATLQIAEAAAVRRGPQPARLRKTSHKPRSTTVRTS